MKALVMDNDFINRRILQLLFTEFGRCDAADSGNVTLSMVEDALKKRRPYSLIVLNTFSQVDWVKMLHEIKAMERSHALYGKDGARIMVMSSDTDKKTIITAFRNQCDAFIQKPAKKREIKNALSSMGITPEPKSFNGLKFYK